MYLVRCSPLTVFYNSSDSIVNHLIYKIVLKRYIKCLSQDEINELTPSDVCDLLDENSYYAPEVIYYADAWEIVAGSAFNKYSADFLDFSECEGSLDCIMQEANSLVNDVYRSERVVIASEVLESLQSKN